MSLARRGDARPRRAQDRELSLIEDLLDDPPSFQDARDVLVSLESSRRSRDRTLKEIMGHLSDVQQVYLIQGLMRITRDYDSSCT
jgi:hypothetical protein